MSSNKNKNPLVPPLRFTEFRNAEKWTLETFGAIYTFKSTNSLSRDKLNYESGSIKNVHYGDIHTKFSAFFDVGREEVPFINVADEPQNVKEDSFCAEGDMIFADASEDLDDIGKSIEVIRLHGQKLLSGLHTLLARQKDNKLIVGFGGHLFQSNGIRTQIQKEAQGAKVLGISAGRMSDIRIYYPQDKKEQQKIADCLSSLDEAMAAQARKVGALREHKKALMQSLFPREGQSIPQLRFAEFRNAGEWEKFPLRAISPAVFDGTHQTPSYTSEGVPFFSVENVVSGNKNKFISYEDYKIATSKNRPEKGDILLTRIGKIGFSQVVTWNYDFSVYVTLAVVKQSRTFNSFYLHYFMQSDRYQTEILSKSLLNAIPCKINMDSLRDTEILLPKLNEQQKVAEFLLSLDEAIAAHGQKLDALTKHKRGLMQQLFPALHDTGER